MIRLARFALVIGAMTTAISIAAAQTAGSVTPAHRDAAKRLMVATGAAEQIEAFLPDFIKSFEDALIANNANQDEVRRTMPRMQAKFLERKQELIDIVADLYAARLSQEELEALAAYFSGGVGRKFILQQPQILKELSEPAQKWGFDIGQEVARELFQEQRKGKRQ